MIGTVNTLARPCPTHRDAPRARPGGARPVPAAWRLAVPAVPALLALLAESAGAAPALAPALPDELQAEVRRVATEAARLVLPASASGARIEVEIGRPDPRLTLAACQQIVPFLPPGARALGATRIGLRCAQGPTAWRVSLPMQVRAWAPALTARAALPIGTVLRADHLARAEIDLAARADAALIDDRDALGRTLQRGLAAGDALRSGDIRVRQYFQSGDTVRVVAVGNGFSVSGEGQALGPGTEGRNTQVRLSGGRVVTGVAAGERLVEVNL